MTIQRSPRDHHEGSKSILLTVASWQTCTFSRKKRTWKKVIGSIAYTPSETGITIHLVNEDYDKGEIIFQKRIKIPTNTKVEDIIFKVQELEKKYFPKIIEEYLLNEKWKK